MKEAHADIKGNRKTAARALLKCQPRLPYLLIGERQVIRLKGGKANCQKDLPKKNCVGLIERQRLWVKLQMKRQKKYEKNKVPLARKIENR